METDSTDDKEKEEPKSEKTENDLVSFCFYSYSIKGFLKCCNSVVNNSFFISYSYFRVKQKKLYKSALLI